MCNNNAISKHLYESGGDFVTFQKILSNLFHAKLG